MKKHQVKICCVFITCILAMTSLVSLAGINALLPSYADAATPTLSLSIGGVSKSITSFSVDPMTLTEGEKTGEPGTLEISEFNLGVTGNMSVVYTTNWPYKNTVARSSATDYAFTRSGSTFKLSEIKQGGDVTIPVNGIVVSITDGVWNGATVGATLTSSSFTVPSYAGAVEINGTGSYNANRNIRISINDVNRRRNDSEHIYYNNEWGKTSGQNEWGVEVKFSLDSNGVFVVTAVREMRNTTQLEIGAKDFVLSVHGSYRAFLGSGLFLKVGDTANLVGMKFADLNKSASASLTVMNPTGPVKSTDLDDLNDGKYFPGFRATNYLMYYDKSYVKSTDPKSNNMENYTGCNEWGYEVLVKVTNRTATEIVGVVSDSAKQLDSLLNEDSFILSGNGTAEAFLTQNSLTGAEVSVNVSTKKVTVTSTPLSYISTVVYRFETVNEMMQSAVDAKYKLNYIGAEDTAADNKWTRSKAEVEALIGKDTDAAGTKSMWGIKASLEAFSGTVQQQNVLLAEFNDKYLGAMNGCFQIESMSYANPVIMSIALWHRPNSSKETNLQGVKDTLAVFQRANVNTVYLETFWNGFSMSDNSNYVDYHKDFKDYVYTGYKDYLDCFVNEAHKLGIEVHAWVENFFVGYKGFDESNVLTGKKPNSTEDAPDKLSKLNWPIRDYQGNEFCQFEGGEYKFIDPSNPAVRKFLEDYYKELLTRYDIDGINLDYIRYPVQNGYTGNVPYDHGYSEFAAAKFLEEQGVAAGNRTLSYLKKQLSKLTSFKPEETKAAWDAFKVRQITEYVEEIHDMVKELDKTRKTAVPSYQTGAQGFSRNSVVISTAVFAGSDALTKKSQDWETWVKEGFIEVTTPMAYYKNSDTVTAQLKGMVNKINGLAYNYAGIAAFFQGLQPMEEVYQALASLAGGTFGTVIFDSKTLINSESALEFLSSGIYSSPAVTPHSETQNLLDKFSDEMLSRTELYDIKASNLAAYNGVFEKLKEMPHANATQMLAILRQILSDTENVENFASGHAVTRITEELDNLYNVLNVRYKRMAKGWEGEAETPVPADLGALNTSVSNADALSKDKYTADSWAAVAAALENAKAVLQKTGVTQAEADEAARLLKVAVDALKEVTPNDNLALVIGLAAAGAVVVAGAVVTVVLVRKKNKGAK